MKFSIHQRVALSWVFTAPFFLAELIHAAGRPDASAVAAWGFAIVTIMLMAAPMVLRFNVVRRLYCWTDALSEAQRQALSRRDLRAYYKIARDDDYLERVLPYLVRIIATIAVLMAIETVLFPPPSESSQYGLPVVDAIKVFWLWYPLGAMALALASCPLQHILRKALLRGK